MSRGHILIVDDEDSIRHSLQGILQDEGFTTTQASDGDEALAILHRESPDVVLLDVWLPGLDGIKALQAVREQRTDLEVIMMSGHANIETAVKATKLGAFDFIEKPLSLDQVVHTVELAVRQQKLMRGNADFKDRLDKVPELLGRSQAVLELWKKIELASSNPSPIVIFGESGTGKELVAHLIQVRRSGIGHAFSLVDCDWQTQDSGKEALFQTIFGVENQRGKIQLGQIEAVEKGTLYLFALERMNSQLASRMAETLESGEFFRENGRNPISFDAQIVLSTNNDLRAKPLSWVFGEGLAGLIQAEPIRVPPLRERWEDIRSLVEHFVSQYCSKHGLRRPVFDEEALQAIEKYNWADNIRSLKNFVEDLVAREKSGEEIVLSQLPVALRGWSKKGQKPFVQAKENMEWERGYLYQLLRKNDGNLRKTAIQLGISEGALRAKMKACGLDSEEPISLPGTHQRSLGKSVLLSGQGLHSGHKTGLILSPLPPDSGILFGNITTEDTVSAHLDNVVSTAFATTLQQKSITIRTIEHLMATLHAYGISNALIRVEEEIPIMDGSALQFCQLIEEAGVVDQTTVLEPLKIKTTEEVVTERVNGEASVLRIEPDSNFVIEFTLKLPKPIGEQKFSFTLSSSEAFQNEIAPARTFGKIKDVEQQGKRGLVEGGRLDNVILLDEGRVINTELRFHNEFVRHKILDVIGDLYLLGRPILGRVTGFMSGHTENIKLLRKLRSE